VLWSVVVRFSPGETGTGCGRGLYVCKQAKSSGSQGIVAICRPAIERGRCGVDPRKPDDNNAARRGILRSTAFAEKVLPCQAIARDADLETTGD